MIDFGMVMALLTAFLLNIISKYHVKQDEEARVFCGGNGPAPNVMMPKCNDDGLVQWS